MRRILPSWWKRTIVAAGLLLLAVIVLHRGGPKLRQDNLAKAVPEDSHSAHRAGNLIPGGAAPSIQTHEAPTTKHAPAEASSNARNANLPASANALLEERRRMLNERRECAQRLMRQSSGELISRLGALWGSPDPPERLEEKSLVIDALTVVLRGDN